MLVEGRVGREEQGERQYIGRKCVWRRGNFHTCNVEEEIQRPVAIGLGEPGDGVGRGDIQLGSGAARVEAQAPQRLALVHVHGVDIVALFLRIRRQAPVCQFPREPSLKVSWGLAGEAD